MNAPTLNTRSKNNRLRLVSLLALAALAGAGALLLAGPSDNVLEKQKPHWHIDHIPPAPVLSPAEELKTFRLPPGFKIELVAAEPMVEEPVALSFDADGRMYVVEMRGYMPDFAGTGELDPVGRVSLLESTKRDGVFDKSTIFIDKLVVPRAVSATAGGVLIAEPPNLWFCKDTNGDGKADTKEVIATDYAVRRADPEHDPNGLVWMLDNGCYSADWTSKLRYVKGKFVREGTINRGQWGITQDDHGRIFYNSNGSMLRCDLVPAAILSRNPFLEPAGVNVAVASNATFPSRVNPGCNRGYTEDCNDKGYLQRLTAACGPQIYRGDLFPQDCRGNAFVCEPAGNLVSRQVLTQDGLKITAKTSLHDGDKSTPEKIDFLTSSDERFRPVSLYNGPDGALYVIDMYHGILQHKAYMSAYLADQVKQRDLDKNNGHRGRIWRIVPDNAKPPAAWPKLAEASTQELVATLSNPNGWWRDTAQRLLVEHNDPKSVEPLEKLASAKDAPPLARLHAIWALQGMDRLEDELVGELLKDKDAQVRVQALRAAESLVRNHTGNETIAALPGLANDPDPEVQIQVLSLATPDNVELQKVANGILARHLSEAIFRSAALSAAAGRELELMRLMLSDPQLAHAGDKHRQQMYNDLAECVIRGRSAERIDKLFDLIANLPAAQKSERQGMLTGVLEAIMPDPKAKHPVTPRKLRLPAEPAGLAKLKGAQDEAVAELAEKLDGGFTWPNKPGDNTPPLKPLTEVESKRFAAGHELYGAICAACHQPSGLGMEGLAPPLLDSEWALGTPDRPIRIVLNGLTGPVKIGKKTFDSEMPNLRALDDEQIASVLTYIRREWGHEGSPVDPQRVAKIRQETADRGDQQWMADELMKVK